MSEFLTLVNEANADPLGNLTLALSRKYITTIKPRFRKLQNIVVNVISLPVMTLDKFSYISYKFISKKEVLTNVGILTLVNEANADPLWEHL